MNEPERSQNEIAQDIIDLCPKAAPLVEEWFAVLVAVHGRMREDADEEPWRALRDLHAAARTAERELPEGALGQRWQKAMAVARTTLRRKRSSMPHDHGGPHE